MPSQHQSKTPQPTPGHVCNYSQVADEELVILTDNSTDTKREKSVEKACQQEEVEQREREHEAERKAKREEAKRWKAEERLEAERRKRAEEEEEAQRKKAAEKEAERQRQRASEERAQARWDKAAQRLCGMVYNVNTAQRVPGTSVVVTATRQPPCTHCVASLTAGQCGGSKRPQLEAAEDKNEEADKGVEGDNEEEEEVGGEKEGGEEQEGGGGQAMEE
ncbi:hypothetical protein M404DRAFT_34919 [Pisolithus tinctorius Marx 270]|uniref:Uncharacterized protein n=1 Tax=Pisolithus tinctorius Marx 270 TaxID=870435 RepID=A0A0C3N0B8_PISTI|nr:hypothetical protein M404DRAFT_34919 [Pisolithus tinctorius Marx 270]